jgi:hypothetical protein
VNEWPSFITRPEIPWVRRRNENGSNTDRYHSHLFSYFCPDLDLNTDSINHAGCDTFGYRHHKYAIWVFGYGYGIEC